jgi:hypothetical protein
MLVDEGAAWSRATLIWSMSCNASPLARLEAGCRANRSTGMQRTAGMKPFRAFVAAFFMGLAVLFSGHGLVDFMTAEAQDVRASGSKIPTA